MSKLSLLFLLPLASLLITSIYAAEPEDIVADAMPNTFVNGEVTDADQVNANFQYLLNDIKTIKAYLEEQKALKTDPARYAGSFTIYGMEITFGGCPVGADAKDGSLALTMSKITGSATVTVTDGLPQISVSFSEERTFVDNNTGDNDPNEDYVLTSGTDSSNLPITMTANGDLIGPVSHAYGKVASDGNSFVFISGEPRVFNPEGGCYEGYTMVLNGVRDGTF